MVEHQDRLTTLYKKGLFISTLGVFFNRETHTEQSCSEGRLLLLPARKAINAKLNTYTLKWEGLKS